MAEEDLSSALCGRGALGVEALPSAGGPPGWITLRAYFERGHLLPSKEELMAACPVAGPIHLVSVADFEDGHWVERWIASLGRLEIGERFEIIPVPDPDSAALPSPGEAPSPEGRLTLRIVPGRAFGTGEHATTRLCLEALATHHSAEGTVLDVGTGSGILAIAAAALGSRSAVGIDTDGEALQVARRNVRLNRHASRVHLAQAGPEAIGSGFDQVVANISAGTLEDLMPDLLRCLRPGGCLILSGLLEHEAAEVAAAAVRGGAEPLASDASEGWACTVHRSPHA